MQKKVKGFEPPNPVSRDETYRDQIVDNHSSGRDREGVNDITDEASLRSANDVLRQTLRGDETKGDADDRDISGSVESKDTPQGREETKNDKSGAANQNG